MNSHVHVTVLSSHGVNVSCHVSSLSLVTGHTTIDIGCDHVPYAGIVEPSIVTLRDVHNVSQEYESHIHNNNLYCVVKKGLIRVYHNTVTIAVSVVQFPIMGGESKTLASYHQLTNQLVGLRLSSDIEDINRHLDNVKYLKAQLSLYSHIYDHH